MRTALERYRLWAHDPYFDVATRQELTGIAHDMGAVEERFSRSLEFGTAGLRGVIAAGTNRMNQYVVRQATQGLAEYIASFGDEPRARGVVIAHDSRRCSPEFAREAALTLCANGIVAYMWESLRPVPMLSYAVRKLGAVAGIVITASHNPKDYNGYKVYWEDGGQVAPERAAAIQGRIGAIGDLTAIHPMAMRDAIEAGLLRPVPESVDQAYARDVVALAITPLEQRAACHVLFTPIHGAGNIPVRKVLSQAGFCVSVVPEQELPDPEFPTVRTPNPEDPSVFHLALEQAGREAPDVIMATDPDADRLGLMARDEQGQYRHLDGNQTGALLADFLIQSRPLPPNPAIVKSIATSNMIVPLCRESGVSLFETHTGFKYIGDIIREFEETGSHSFLLGFEESYGYLGAAFVRDKDAVMAALLVADAVAYHKARGRTLYGALQRIWERCGYFQEALHNVSLPGPQGQARIDGLMERLRQNPPLALGGIPVGCADDYSTGTSWDFEDGVTRDLELDTANVLHYRFVGGGFVMVRPSGTEPKLKIYFSVAGQSPEEAARKLAAVREDTLHRMGLAQHQDP